MLPTAYNCGLLGVHFQSPRRNFGVESMRNAPWEISDPIEVANRFSSYFSSIGPNLARKILSPPCQSHKDFLYGAFRESIFFNPTTKDEIITVAQSFASGKAAGYDSIPMSITS